MKAVGRPHRPLRLPVTGRVFGENQRGRPAGRIEPIDQQLIQTFAVAVRERKEGADGDRTAVGGPCRTTELAALRRRPRQRALRHTARPHTHELHVQSIDQVCDFRPVGRPGGARKVPRAAEGDLTIAAGRQVADPHVHRAVTVRRERQFTTDRDGTMNVWVRNLATGRDRQVTFSRTGNFRGPPGRPQ